MVAQRRPDRTLGGIHDQFWHHCNSRELRLQQCRNCGTFTWPPVSQCEQCGHTVLQWRPVSGRGRLLSWATFEHRYYEELPVPWDTVLVALDEGPLFVSNPIGFTRDDMRAGLEVEVDFLECEDSAGAFLLPAFRKRLP